MILILCTADHLDRARVLQTHTLNSQVFDIAQKQPVTMPGLDTIVFWGHCGGAASFCDLNTKQFADLVANWCKQNASLRAIETISCNLVHSWDQNLNINFDQSFMTLAKAQMANTKAKNITIKTMPRSPTGFGSFSILLWSPPTETWAYLAAPGGVHPNYTGGDKQLSDLQAFFRYENPSAVRKIQRQNPNFISVFQEYLRLNEFDLPNNQYVKTGTITNLRSLLVTI